MKSKLFCILLFVFSTLFVSAQSNLLDGWDGRGDTNQNTSFPDKYGWSVSEGVFNYANAGSGLRWMDVSGATHQLNGANYAGRLMMLRWDGAGSTTLNSIYSFPVTLEAHKNYKFSCIYEWWNNASVPTLTMGISKDKLAAENLITKDFQCSSTKNLLLNGDMSFFVKEAGVYYLTIKANNLAVLCAIGDLSVKEVPSSLGANVSAVQLSYFDSKTDLDIYPNGSSDLISIEVPENVLVTPLQLPSIGGTITVSTKDSTDISGDIVVTQGNDKFMIPITGIFPEDFNPTEIATVTEKGAWCWFADPRALHFENESGTINNTYIGYIDVHGAIKATQVDHINNITNEVLIRSYFQPDDHNNPTFLVLPDERIMVFYSRHTDEACFYYRISQKPGDITTLGKEVRLATANNTTYPSPFILADDPDHIYLCWRGIGWHPTIGRLPMPTEANNDVVDFDWGPYQMVRSNNGASGVRPYAKYASNGKDKIYMTYTTTHPDNQSVNYVYFNYVDVNDRKLKDIKGKELAVVGSGTLHDVAATSTYYNANPDAVVDNSSFRNWIWQVSMDAQENPVIAMVRINEDKSSHDYYYAKWTGSEWRKTFLENGGGPFHQTPSIEKCYSGGMAIDNSNPNIIYCSVPVDGKYGKIYEIKKYTIAADGTLASSVQLTGGSEKNNVRPYIIPNSKDKNMMAWMYGDYYDWIVSSTRPLGYPTGIRANFEIPVSNVDLDNGLLVHNDFDDAEGLSGNAIVTNGVLSVTESQKTTISLPSSVNSFSIVLSPFIDNANYQGEIFKAGTLSYGVSSTNSSKPYVKVGDNSYSSTNVLGNSDVWQTLNRSTGGEWPGASKFKFFSLVLSYENGILRTYINGLLDQYIEVNGLNIQDLTIGGFKGVVEDCRVYNRVLSQDEVKAISIALQESIAGKDAESEFSMLSVPKDVYTDVVLKKSLSTGNTVTWTSSDETVITNAGLVTLPQQSKNITLTAQVDNSEIAPRVFSVTVYPRNIEKNRLLLYEFAESDVYTDSGVRYVIDKSGNNNDGAVFGSAQVKGTLDLSANTNAGFSTNGYAIAPAGLLNDLRSYSFLMKINPSRLDKQPRVFDFGTASSNSVFGRLNGFCAGLKYNGGTTVLINSTTALTVSNASSLAFVFDAATKTTKVYLNGDVVASATTITNEPYQIAMLGVDNRNYIGRTQWWDSSSSGDNADYCGTIDDFYLFDIALTQEEIKQIQEDKGSGITPDQLTGNLFRLQANPVSCNDDVYIYASNALKGSYNIQVVNAQGVNVISTTAKSFPVSVGKISQSGIYLVKIAGNSNDDSTLKLVVK